MVRRINHWIFKRQKYYYRLRSVEDGIEKDFLIPLEIDMSLSTIQQKHQAEKRGLMVHQQRKNFLNGIIDKTYFEWINEDKVSKVKSMTLEDAINFHKELKNSTDIKKKSKKWYYAKYKDILDCLGKNLSFENITHTKVLQLNNYAKQKSKSHDGYRKIMFAFNSIIQDCYKYKLREWNLDYKNKPIIDIPKKKELLPDYLTEDQFNKLMSVKDYNLISKKNFGADANYLKKVFKFFYDTGCRLKEPFVGKIHNLKNSQYIMYVLPDDAKAGGGVENTNRIIYITKEQKDFILDFQKKAKDKNYPMINIENTENISKQFKKFVRHLFGDGTKLHLHSLRHTYAVRLYLKTGDIKEVSMKLGHKNLKTTEIYTKFNMALIQSHHPSFKSRFFD